MTQKIDPERQLIAAQKIMDRYDGALAALAGKPISEEIAQKMQVARERMKKYRTVYERLAE